MDGENRQTNKYIAMISAEREVYTQCVKKKRNISGTLRMGVQRERDSLGITGYRG